MKTAYIISFKTRYGITGVRQIISNTIQDSNDLSALLETFYKNVFDETRSKKEDVVVIAISQITLPLEG